MKPQRIIYTATFSRGYGLGDYTLEFTTAEERDAFKPENPKHTRFQRGQRFNNGWTPENETLEQRIQRAKSDGNTETAVGLAMCLPKFSSLNDDRAEFAAVALVGAL